MSFRIDSAITADIGGMQPGNLFRLVYQDNLLYRCILLGSECSQYKRFAVLRCINYLIFLTAYKKDNSYRISAGCVVFNIRQEIQKYPNGTANTVCTVICFSTNREQSSGGIFFDSSLLFKIHKRMPQAFTNIRMQKVELLLGDAWVHRNFGDQLHGHIVINMKIV